MLRRALAVAQPEGATAFMRTTTVEVAAILDPVEAVRLFAVTWKMEG